MDASRVSCRIFVYTTGLNLHLMHERQRTSLTDHIVFWLCSRLAPSAAPAKIALGDDFNKSYMVR